MKASPDECIEYARHNREQFLSDLATILRIPSISTSPENEGDVHNAALALAELLAQTGIENIRVMPTAGHPVVYGDWLRAGNQAITVLVYGHYDVQPVDPIELWDTDPFEPTILDDYIFARGASDMKGQVIATLSAIRSVLHTGEFPVNLKFLFEGEEEIGSPSLKAFLEQNRELYQSDVALNPDAGMVAANTPTIVYSLRGLAFFELLVRSAERDLHSGMFGGVVHNPAVALSELIAGMHDSNGTVTLPGFYDRVRKITPEEHKQLQRLPMEEDYYQIQSGAVQLWGEREFLPVERVGARPTLEVNGMISGYTGAGTKTVLPATALAKISCRLVADQNPIGVFDQMKSYLEAHAPKTITYELTYLGGNPACATDPNSPTAAALAAALEKVWGTEPVYKREGGSIPVVGDMQQILGVDSVLTGFGLPDDHIHSPNERLNLPNWYKGIEALIHFFFNLAKDD